tara:strand:+ start:26462 stop:28213 length:1752 start_codon:yes stop_codon:yes gene_type:complete
MISDSSDNSASNTLWSLYPASSEASLLANHHNISPRLAQLMLNRGVNPQEFSDFLNPTLATTTPDPSHLLDMDKAVDRILKALKNNEKITVFGDYDVDGATSSASLILFFRALGHDLDFYIPQRDQEGYGPNIPAFDKLKQQGTQVVITVDCGATAHEPLAYARKIGLDVIVLDHHLGVEQPPETCALVNPNRPDESTSHTNLAAVGVTFLFIIALRQRLRQNGHFSDAQPEPKLTDLVPLAALGSVCDVMTLQGFNRTLVKQGLKVLDSGHILPGLQALIQESSLTPPFKASQFGFILGPRINAAGRIDDASLGTRLLSKDSLDDEAQQIAQRLHHLNQERQSLEQATLQAAKNQIPQNLTDNFVLVTGHDWSAGVIGLVAGRLKEAYHKPAFAISYDASGTGKGSARSINGFDVGTIIQQAVAKGHLQSGGGHAMAGGFTLKKDQQLAFETFLKKQTQNLVTTRTYNIDAPLSLDAVNITTYNELAQLEPYGNGNPKPLFLFKDCSIKFCTVMGKNHIRLTLVNGFGAQATAVLFRAFERPYGHELLDSIGKQIDLIGSLNLNRYNGSETIQILVDDLKFL